MINNLLSKPFSDVLKKMDKIEITKPKEKINYLINKILISQKRKEYRDELTQKLHNNNKKKIHIIKVTKNYSTNLTSLINQNLNTINTSKTRKLNLIPKYVNNEEKQNENVRYGFISAKNIKTKSLNLTRTTKKVFRKNFKEILKFSPDKDIFSKSMLNKKKYLDSFYEKELDFQKKLLKLKSYDMEVVHSGDYNQQKIIKEAQQDFDIIKCFAESKNTKKNLINLVGESELKNWDYMMKNKGRARVNRKMNIVNINNLNSFMKMNHINQARSIFNPDDTSKNNNEKIKSLIAECAKLEEMKNKCKMQKDIL
jgi:hypothetical protein